MEIATELNAEIVAVDAFTVYRGMDIGTAKPSAEDRTVVPHHVVDVLGPHETCTVEWFQSVARAAIDEVLLRGRVPLLVGGSGLYFRAVVDPLEFPPTDADVRDAVAQRYAGDPAAAHAALTAADPQAAAHMDPGNLRRAVRALEVLELTGRPFSDWRRAWDHHDSIYPGLHVVGLAQDRAGLSAALSDRVDGMLAAGWLEECRALSDLPLSTAARQAIGYAELFDHLAGTLPLDDAVTRIKHRTRQYATRQERWFRADPRVQWAAAHEARDLMRNACNF